MGTAIKDLVTHRLLMAKEKIRSAEILLREKAYRDSISRSYYGIFSAIRAVLSTKNLDSPKHLGVISLFNREFVKTGEFPKRFSKILKKGQLKREDSDYEEFTDIRKRIRWIW